MIDLGYCDLHQRENCTLCDECGHQDHLWAPGYEAAGDKATADFIYEHATCWAENICRECAPELYAAVLALARPITKEA